MKKLFFVCIALGLFSCNLFGQMRINKLETEKIDGIMFYKGEKLTGTVVNMFGELIFSETEYKKGKIDGARKIYHYNRQLKVVDHFKNGKRDGITKLYLPSGQLVLEKNYKRGKEVTVD